MDIDTAEGNVVGNASGAIVPGPSGDADSTGGGRDATASRIATALLGDMPNGLRFESCPSGLAVSGSGTAGRGAARTITAWAPGKSVEEIVGGGGKAGDPAIATGTGAGGA